MTKQNVKPDESNYDFSFSSRLILCIMLKSDVTLICKILCALRSYKNYLPKDWLQLIFLNCIWLVTVCINFQMLVFHFYGDCDNIYIFFSPPTVLKVTKNLNVSQTLFLKK